MAQCKLFIHQETSSTTKVKYESSDRALNSKGFYQYIGTYTRKLWCMCKKIVCSSQNKRRRKNTRIFVESGTMKTVSTEEDQVMELQTSWGDVSPWGQMRYNHEC